MQKLSIDRPRPAVPNPWSAGPASAWVWLLSICTRLRQERQRRAELQELDAATLRDLALDRSELDSCAAEAAGSAEPTRRRVVRAGPEVPPTWLPARLRRSPE